MLHLCELADWNVGHTALYIVFLVQCSWDKRTWTGNSLNARVCLCFCCLWTPEGWGVYSVHRERKYLIPPSVVLALRFPAVANCQLDTWVFSLACTNTHTNTDTHNTINKYTNTDICFHIASENTLEITWRGKGRERREGILRILKAWLVETVGRSVCWTLLARRGSRHRQQVKDSFTETNTCTAFLILSVWNLTAGMLWCLSDLWKVLLQKKTFVAKMTNV